MFVHGFSCMCACMYVCVCACMGVYGGGDMGKEQSEPLEGRLRGFSHAAVRAVFCCSSSSPSSPSSGWTCCCACSCCSSASKVPASGTFASVPKKSSAASPLAPRVAAAALVVAAPAWVGGWSARTPAAPGVVRRVGGRRHLEDVDRAVGRGKKGAACGVQVYRLQHARRQPVAGAGAGEEMMFYTGHNIRGEATRRVCPVAPSRQFPVNTATPGTAAMGGAGALTLPRTVRLVRSQTRQQNLVVSEGATLAARLDTSIVKVRAAAVCCSLLFVVRARSSPCTCHWPNNVLCSSHE